MTKGRETTKAERVAVAKSCLSNGNNYGEVAIAYNVSYQQARNWTLKYLDGGESALEDRRGGERRTRSHEQNWSRYILRTSNSNID